MRNKKKSHLDRFDSNFLEKAKKYAFLFGAFGAHDFLLKRWIRGALHILLWVTPMLFYNPMGEEICKNLGGCQNNTQIDNFYIDIIAIFVSMIIISYVWAAIEGAIISEVLYKRTPEYKKQQKEAKAEAKAELVAEKIETKKSLKTSRQKAKDYADTAKKFDTIAVILLIITVTPVLFCLISSGGDFNEGTGNGAVWWLMVYFIPIMLVTGPIGLIFLMAGITNSILSAKHKKQAKK